MTVLMQQRRRTRQQVVKLFTLPVWSTTTHFPRCMGNRSPRNSSSSISKNCSQDGVKEFCCVFHPCLVTFAQHARAVCHPSVSVLDLSSSGNGIITPATVLLSLSLMTSIISAGAFWEWERRICWHFHLRLFFSWSSDRGKVRPVPAEPNLNNRCWTL